MKNIKFLLAFAIIFAVSCNSDDDGFYNTKYIEATNLVTIDTEPSFNVGDNLYVDAEIPNILPESGQSTPLDIRQTTGNAPSFIFSYYIEKNTGGDTWEYVDLTGNFTAITGSGNSGAFVEAFAEYIPFNDAYLFRGAIELTQPGNYRMSFDLNSLYPNKASMISRSQENNITLNISSSVADINAQGYYFFTVN